MDTLCPSAPVRCALVTFPVGNLKVEPPQLKGTPRVRIMTPRTINENFSYPGYKKKLSPLIFEKIGGPY